MVGGLHAIFFDRSVFLCWVTDILRRSIAAHSIRRDSEKFLCSQAAKRWAGEIFDACHYQKNREQLF